MKVIRSVINTVVAAAVLVLFAIFLLPRIFGYQPYMVVSASMRQSFPVGSLIFVTDATPEEIKVGDPITFSSGTLTITHRVIEIDNDQRIFVTKGDNNAASERISFDSLKGRALNFAVPYMGYFAAWFTTPQGRVVTGIVLVCFLLLGIVIGKMAELEDEDDAEEAAAKAAEDKPADETEQTEQPTEEADNTDRPAGEADMVQEPEALTQASEETVLRPEDAVSIINEELERKEGEINEQ